MHAHGFFVPKSCKRTLQEPQLVVKHPHYHSINLEEPLRKGSHLRIKVHVQELGVDMVHACPIAWNFFLEYSDRSDEVKLTSPIGDISTHGFTITRHAFREWYARKHKRDAHQNETLLSPCSSFIFSSRRNCVFLDLMSSPGFITY
jgi:hypothetical protein